MWERAVAKYMVVMEQTQTYQFEVDTDHGPIDAQEIATSQMGKTHPIKNELSITTERMTA